MNKNIGSFSLKKLALFISRLDKEEIKKRGPQYFMLKNNWFDLDADIYKDFNLILSELFSEINIHYQIISLHELTKITYSSINLYSEDRDFENYFKRQIIDGIKNFNVFVPIENLSLNDAEHIEILGCKLLTLSNAIEQGLIDKETFEIFNKIETIKNEIVVSKVNVEAICSKSANLQAKEQTQSIISLINFSTGFFKHELDVDPVYLSGYLKSDSVVSTIIVDNENNSNFTINSKLYRNKELNFQKVLESNKKKEFYLKTIEKFTNDNNFYRKTFKKVVFTLANSFWLEDINQKFLDYMTCLETLLTSSSNTEKTFRISLYTSFLATNKYHDRIEMYDKMNKLYTKRSNYTHTLKSDIDNYDINFLESVLKRILYIIINDDINLNETDTYSNNNKEQKWLDYGDLSRFINYKLIFNSNINL